MHWELNDVTISFGQTILKLNKIKGVLRDTPLTPQHLVIIGFGRAGDQMGQKGQYFAKINAKFGNFCLPPHFLKNLVILAEDFEGLLWCIRKDAWIFQSPLDNKMSQMILTLTYVYATMIDYHRLKLKG